ncbi:hypothetical protein BaRGS_00033012 [Batillaria attramentaria]|uniref:Uncharacterized protein n=1 Tax=Batillaria attramentaria TaxID=370345 RepID=A0ABD0JLY0_9CAEN
MKCLHHVLESFKFILYPGLTVVSLRSHFPRGVERGDCHSFRRSLMRLDNGTVEIVGTGRLDGGWDGNMVFICVDSLRREIRGRLDWRYRRYNARRQKYTRLQSVSKFIWMGQRVRLISVLSFLAAEARVVMPIVEVEVDGADGRAVDADGWGVIGRDCGVAGRDCGVAGCDCGVAGRDGDVVVLCVSGCDRRIVVSAGTRAGCDCGISGRGVFRMDRFDGAETTGISMSSPSSWESKSGLKGTVVSEEENNQATCVLVCRNIFGIRPTQALGA